MRGMHTHIVSAFFEGIIRPPSRDETALAVAEKNTVRVVFTVCGQMDFYKTVELARLQCDANDACKLSVCIVHGFL
jgi:hypothetical protein